MEEPVDRALAIACGVGWITFGPFADCAGGARSSRCGVGWTIFWGAGCWTRGAVSAAARAARKSASAPKSSSSIVQGRYFCESRGVDST